MAVTFKKGGRQPLFTEKEIGQAKDVKSRVKLILATVKEAVRNDRILTMVYMQEFHGITTFEQYARRSDVPTLESIRRTRQKLAQNYALAKRPNSNDI